MRTFKKTQGAAKLQPLRVEKDARSKEQGAIEHRKTYSVTQNVRFL